MSLVALFAFANVCEFYLKILFIVLDLRNIWMKNCINVSLLGIVPTNLVQTNSNILVYAEIFSSLPYFDEANALNVVFYLTSDWKLLSNSLYI